MSKWDLSVFYKSVEEWEEDFKKLPQMIEELASFQGKLHNFEDFKKLYLKDEELEKFIYRLYGYAHLASDLNLKDQDTYARNQRMMLVFNQLGQKMAFVTPEILSLGKEKVDSFIERDDFLKQYAFPLAKTFFQQEHVLDQNSEQLLANFSPLGSVSSGLYQALAIIDANDEDIVLSDGRKITVTQSNYRSLFPTIDLEEDRDLVFSAAFKRYKENKAAFANTYNLVLQNQAAYYKSRNFSSALAMKLHSNNIPESVYLNLMAAAKESTKPIKKYLSLRKKHLGLKKYHTYDRFLKLVKDDTKYSFEEAKEIFFKAIDGMDKEFVDNQHEALRDGFVDAYPQDGKRTGAYSSGLYGFHPFILLNHDETLDSVFTLAHEAGHSAHTIFSNASQPMATADYTIFVAEIASTFNEHVLLDYLVKNAKTKSQKIDLLETALDGIMGTFFRQTLFATYEYEANKLVEQGVPISADVLSKIMIDLYKEYYDLDITTEDGKEYVWAYIPHLFYTPFYVYQYSTSYSASLKIYDNVKSNQKDAMANYLRMLKSGGNDFPVEQVKLAGADLTKKETFLAVVKRFEQLLDELESTLES